MFIVIFGLTGVGFKTKHEFGIKTRSKLLRIECLFFVVFRVSNDSNWLEYKKAYCDDENATLSWHPQVRLARKKGFLKGKAEALRSSGQDYSRLKENYLEQCAKTSELQNKMYTLKQTIKGLHLINDQSEKDK